MAALEYFTVTYDALGVSADRSTDEDALPDIRPMTCNVEFVYRVPPGHAFRAVDYTPRPTDLGFDNFVCRVDEGRLKQINGTLNFQLPANTAVLGWSGDLYIDVVFTNIVYARGTRKWRNFAFIAPTTGGGTVNLTTVARHPYLPRDKYGEHFADQS